MLKKCGPREPGYGSKMLYHAKMADSKTNYDKTPWIYTWYHMLIQTPSKAPGPSSSTGTWQMSQKFNPKLLAMGGSSWERRSPS